MAEPVYDRVSVRAAAQALPFADGAFAAPMAATAVRARLRQMRLAVTAAPTRADLSERCRHSVRSSGCLPSAGVPAARPPSNVISF